MFLDANASQYLLVPVRLPACPPVQLFVKMTLMRILYDLCRTGFVMGAFTLVMHCIDFGAFALVLLLWYIHFGAFSLVHSLWCILCCAFPLVHSL